MVNRKHAHGGGLPWLALGLFVTLVMSFGLCPAVGIAEDLADAGPDDAVVVEQGQGKGPSATVQSTSGYGVWVGGQLVDGEHLSGQGWSYNASTKTLTLDGYTGGSGYDSEGGPYESEYDVICSWHDLTVELKNTNTLAAGNATGNWFGISTTGNLTITGSGTLNATEGFVSAIAVFGDTLTIDGSAGCKVNATGTECGITARGDAANVVIDGSDGCIVNATGGENGIEARYCSVTINGGTVNATGGKNGILANYLEHWYVGRNVTITGGTVTAKATGESEGYGINTPDGNVTISDTAKVTATGYSCGIRGRLGVTVSGGEVEATATGDTGVGVNADEGQVVSVGAGIASFISSGKGSAFGSNVLVKNAAKGTGWDNAAGTGTGEAIDVSDEGQYLSDYINVKFLRTSFVEVAADPAEGGEAKSSISKAVEGESATLTATPEDGYEFTGWTLGPADTDAKIDDASSPTATLTVGTKDVTATASFQKKPVPVASVTVEPATAALVVGNTRQLNANVKPDNATDKTVTWKSSNEGVAKVDANGMVTAVSAGKATVTATAGGKSGSCVVTVTKEADPIVPTGTGHLQKLADTPAKTSGKGIVIGTTGEARRLEAITVSLPKGVNGTIRYRAHLQGIGWTAWTDGGKACGTTGEARRLEAVQMELTGVVADDYSVWYRVHSQTNGWLGWAKDGQAAGTAGQSRRAEALEVQILPKGQQPADYVERRASYVGAAVADVHLQEIGWTGSASSLEFGTTGQSRRLEAVRISLPNQPLPGGVTYDVHLQGKGWQDGFADGAEAGTTGQSRRLEAVRISLTGDMAKDGNFSVWYRVHSQTYGWLGWAHDGDPAGTTGLARRAEAIDVQVLPQGQVPNGYDASKAACVNG